MAVGDLVTADFMYEFSGVAFGSGTSYRTEEMEGLFGIPDLSTSDLNRLDRHGAIPGDDLMGGRKIIGKINLEELVKATMETKLTAWQTAMRVRNREEQLVYQRPGTGKRYVSARPRKSSYPSDYQLAHGLGKLAVEWFCPDPRHYLLATKTTVVTVASASLTQTTALTVVTGNFETEPVITITGPATNPRLSLSGQTAIDGRSYNGRVFAVDVVMTAGDTMIIDFKNKTIKLNGVDRYDLKRVDSRWWSLLPGAQSLTYSRSAGNTGAAATATPVWNDAWVI